MIGRQNFGDDPNVGLNKKPNLIGARPIPNSMYADQPTKDDLPFRFTTSTPGQTTQSQAKTTSKAKSGKFFQWTVPYSQSTRQTLDTVRAPAWYYQINPLINESTTTTPNPLFLYRGGSKDVQTNVGPPGNIAKQQTEAPFKIHINWVDDLLATAAPQLVGVYTILHFNHSKHWQNHLLLNLTTKISFQVQISNASSKIARLNDEKRNSDSGNEAVEKSTLPTIDLEDLSNKVCLA